MEDSSFFCTFSFPCFPKSSADDSTKGLPQSSTSSSSFFSSSSIASPKVGSIPPPARMVKTFTMSEIIRMTKNFSREIGHGGFGTVYKGQLTDGTIVAVKRAKKKDTMVQGFAQFKSEVTMLSKVEHLNLVCLLGYLEDEREHILVTEYVPNGSLREHLQGPRGLDFSIRLDIMIDVAHALTYLHSYADQTVIHRDIKSTNILLTDTFRAKVADFGFSRAGPSDNLASHVVTGVKGTVGYLDPEYFRTKQLSPKSDVYSFGILMLETISGRPPMEKVAGSVRMTVKWAFDKFEEGRAIDVLDSRIEANPAIVAVLEKLVDLAIQCAAPTKKDRPSMSEVAKTLWNIRREFQSVTHPLTPR